jgi:hypothetical protein
VTALLPAAEHVLDLALDKATTLVRGGRLEEATRVLAVAISAADLIHTAEAETLDG